MMKQQIKKIIINFIAKVLEHTNVRYTVNSPITRYSQKAVSIQRGAEIATTLL